MSKSIISKLFILLLVVGLLFAVAPTKQALAQTTAFVSDETELRAALADTNVTLIELDASFALAATVDVNRSVTIDGKSYTITGPTTYHAINVGANGVTIKNLTITGTTNGHNLQFYRVTGGIVTNVVLSNGGKAGMVVNGSQVTISGVTTTNNLWGGINVDQGIGVTEIPLLTVTNVTTHTSPVSGVTAAIWVDKGNPTWVSVGDIYTVVVAPNGYLVFYDNTEFATIAAGFPVHNETKDIYYANLQQAVAASAAGDIIKVYGTYVLDSVVTLDKAITLTCATSAKIQVSGTGDRFDIKAAATISNCEIEKTDKTGEQNIIRLNNANATNAKILNNKIHGQWVVGDPEVSRAIVVNAGALSGVEISGNEIWALRQPAYISGTHTGTISNNYVHGTKGWVLEGGNLTFTGNTWANNVGDIAIIPQCPAAYYTDIVGMSAANNGAVIEDQRMSPALLSVVYVDDSAAAGGNGTQALPLQTIQAGINRVVPGGTVYVAAGTYAEQLDIAKDVKLIGAGAGQSIVRVPTTLPVASNPASAIVLVHGSGVDAEITGFTIAGPGPSGCGSIRAGLYIFDGGYANIHHNSIEDIRDNADPVSGCQNGVAISIGRQAWSTTGSATIENNTIVRYQKGAIVVDNTGSSAQIKSNTITGIGTTAITAQNGIQISRGATATLTGNVVSGNSYNANTQWDWGAAGVLLYDAGDVTLAGANNFSGNDNHLYISGAGTVAVGAEIFGTSSAPIDYGYFVINSNDAPLNLTAASFPTTDPFEKANRIWDGIDEAGLGLARFEAGHLYVNVGGSIQRAVNLSTQGDTIHVEAGHYDENVTTTTVMNKTVKLIGEVDSLGAPASTLHGKLELNNSLMNEGNLIENIRFEQLSIHDVPYPDPIKKVHDSLYLIQINGITIKNCHFVGSDLDTVGRAIEMDGASNGTDDVVIENCLFTGPYNIGIDRAVQDITVRNTTFDGVRSGMNLQTGGTNLVVENSTFNITALTVSNNAFGIRLGTADAPGSGKQMSVTGSTFNINKNGLVPNAGVFYEAIILRSGVNGVSSEIHNNSIIGGGIINQSAIQVNAIENWWGSPCGPSTIVGSVVVSPWWADAAMTLLKGSVPTGDFTVTPVMGMPAINASIACALPNTTVTFDPGDYTGTIILPPGREYLTLKLKDGVNLKPNSPCITVGSSYTWITTESIGGAACIPSSGSNGIDVAANLVNIEISGLEIDGTGQTTGDGIHVAGALVDTVIVDNNIHDLGGDGIEFVGNVTGVTDIQGNMFKNNTGYGINYGGTAQLGVEYNSWGNYAGPTAGDGANGLLTTTPFTHADLYLVSSGTPWANQVVKGSNITYTVMAHLNQVNAADFVLTYPAELTYVSSTKSGSLGFMETITHNATARTLQFVGASTTGNKSGDLPLFTVTFTGATAGVDKPLAFSYAATSGFGMVGYESSSNVYVNEMVDSTVTIVDLPTISSTDIQGYYLSGEQRQFSVVLTNPLTGADYNHVYVDFTIANAQVAQFGTVEYSVDNGANWVALGTGPGTSIADVGANIVGYFGKVAGGGFPMAPDASLPTLFRVTFPVREQGATDFPTSYAVTMQLRDADSTPAGLLLDDFSDMMYVYDKPTVTVATTDQYLIVGEPGAFTVTINNPTTGRNYNDTVVFDVLIPSHAVSDFSALSCSISSPVAFTWNLLPLLVSDGAGGVKARIVGLDGYFEVPPTGLDMVLTCSVTVTTPGAYSASGNMVDVVSKVAPIVERVVSSNVSLSTTAYTKPTMTAAFPTGPYAAGVPVTVPVTITNSDGIPAPFELVFDLPAGTVINYGGKDYVCTTTCPPIVVTLPLTAADFIITFDEAWTGTAGLSLYDSDWTPSDRLLATASQTGVVVNAGFSFSGTVSMQGNASRAGVPVTFEWGGTLVVYGPTFNTTNAISNNLTGVLTYGGSYTVITNQARYLNISNLPTDTYGITKTITNVSANLLLNTLQLKAGNAVYTDNIVNDQDSGMVASGYINGIGGTFADADVNFDGRANIQDLALVGGNYFLTSATAYSSWSPVTVTP